MKLKFSKMHGAGNDFRVLDGISQSIDLSAEQVRLMADRHLGIGFDQLLLVEASTRADADFRYRIFNADGGEVEQCGNGARCFVRFVLDRGLTDKREITVETRSGLITPRLEIDGRVTVNMGPPRFAPAEIPFLVERQALTYSLEVDGTSVEISALSMGNPHAVQIVENVDLAPVGLQGPHIESHATVSRAGQRRLPADSRSRTGALEGLRTRRGRNPVVRHRRVRSGSGGHGPRPAGQPGGSGNPWRNPDHRVARQQSSGNDDRPGTQGL